MKEQTTWSIILSKDELYLLAGILQTGSLIGVQDPFLGFLADEIEERLEQAKEALSDQDYLRERPGEELVLDSGIAAMVKAITSAKRLFVASLSLDHHTSHYLVHFASDIVVEQAVLPSGDIALTAIRDAQVLKERLENFFSLSNATEPAASTAPLTLSEADFAQVRNLAQEDAKAVRGFLSHKDVPPEAIPALTAALTEGQHMSSLTVLYRDEREMRYGEKLAWLIGSQGAWYVQPLEQDQVTSVRLTPTTMAKIQRRITQTVATLYREINP